MVSGNNIMVSYMLCIVLIILLCGYVDAVQCLLTDGILCTVHFFALFSEMCEFDSFLCDVN